MADRAPDFSIATALAAAGFAGVMLDTADKSAGALPEVLTRARLGTFLFEARVAKLTAGLAGSLRCAHIVDLVNLAPDILGFRGALCGTGRTSTLDAALARGVRDAIDTSIGAGCRHERSVA